MDDDDNCCICGNQAVEYYDDREDCPVCNNPRCAWKIQQGLDYLEEVGNR